MTDISNINNCHVCGGSAPILDAATNLCCVTSDCRPWPVKAELAVCHTCGLTQKRITPSWSQEIDIIYGSYTMYPQAGGKEQASFQSDTGAAQARSQRIMEAITSLSLLPEQGAMLDVGCGNGNMIRSFKDAYPQWALAGHEWDARHADIVRAIPNVTSFFTSFPDDRIDCFDLISMVHVLEHIVDPATYLRKLTSLLRADGLLLIEVPNLRRNPYDLTIFDHCSHFTASSLRRLLLQAGLQIKWLSEDIVSKELTVLCSVGTSEPEPVTSEELSISEECVVWLENLIERAKEINSKNSLGIFGTSIGASWIVSELGRPPDFFLDEDPNRIGKYHLNKPILALDETPQNASIVIPLTTESAAPVSARMSRPDLILIYPF